MVSNTSSTRGVVFFCFVFSSRYLSRFFRRDGCPAKELWESVVTYSFVTVVHSGKLEHHMQIASPAVLFTADRCMYPVHYCRHHGSHICQRPKKRPHLRYTLRESEKPYSVESSENMSLGIWWIVVS